MSVPIEALDNPIIHDAAPTMGNMTSDEYDRLLTITFPMILHNILKDADFPAGSEAHAILSECESSLAAEKDNEWIVLLNTCGHAYKAPDLKSMGGALAAKLGSDRSAFASIIQKMEAEMKAWALANKDAINSYYFEAAKSCGMATQ